MRHYYKKGGKVKSGGKICPSGKAWAKRTFDTYPSAYANMAASKYCKDPNYAKGSKNEFRLRKRDRENVDPELVELYDECMSVPFGERASKWKEHRQRFLEEVGEDKFYQYDEGGMRFDSPDRPSRTIVTDEIGRTPSRMRHIIEYEEGRYRRLSPEETERLNGFPAGWTDIEGIKPSRRGFLMGNALVVGIIERLRGPLRNLINSRGLE